MCQRMCLKKFQMQLASMPQRILQKRFRIKFLMMFQMLFQRMCQLRVKHCTHVCFVKLPDRLVGWQEASSASLLDVYEFQWFATI